MKYIWLLAGLLFTQCQLKGVFRNTTGNLNKELRISLNQTITLIGNNKTNLGKITFTNLEESRCPANTTCIRQGAAVTSFVVQTEGSEEQNRRLFIGDFMNHDRRGSRNRTADTVWVQLKDKARYQLILKAVTPYPGTAAEPTRATIVLKRL